MSDESDADFPDSGSSSLLDFGTDAGTDSRTDAGTNSQTDAADASGDSTAADESATAADERDEIRAALAEVRRECRKVALVYASLDAVCILLAVRLATTLVGIPALATDVAPGTFDSLGLPAPSVGTLLALVVGVLERPIEPTFPACDGLLHVCCRTLVVVGQSLEDRFRNAKRNFLHTTCYEAAWQENLRPLEEVVFR